MDGICGEDIGRVCGGIGRGISIVGMALAGSDIDAGMSKSKSSIDGRSLSVCGFAPSFGKLNPDESSSPGNGALRSESMPRPILEGGGGGMARSYSTFLSCFLLKKRKNPIIHPFWKTYRCLY